MTELIEIKPVGSSVHRRFTLYTDDISSWATDLHPAPAHRVDELDFASSSFASIKRSLRHGLWGVTDPVRQNLWQNLINSLFKGANMYHETVADLYKDGIPEPVPLPTMVDTNHVHAYSLNPHGVNTARLVCAAINSLHPEVSSSPVLFPLAALLLHYVEADVCFHCLEGMVGRRDRRYLPQTRVSVYCASRVMTDLSQRYVVRLSCMDHPLTVRDRINEVFDSWVWWIFRDLPFPHLVCIMDNYLLEGEKVLYRAALTILKKYPKYYKNHNSTVSFTEQVSLFCQEMPIPISAFMRSAFRIRRLSRNKISKLLAKHEPEALSIFRDPLALHNLTPVHRIEGSMLSNDQMSRMMLWLPVRHTVDQPILLYSSDVHGVSIQTLYNQASSCGPTILVIKTDEQEIFGTYCSGDWKERKIYSYFGTGETFVFTLAPSEAMYPWVGIEGSNVSDAAEMYMSGGTTHLIVGGGRTGIAIHLDSHLEHCSTSPCQTFSNPPLCAVNEIGEFVCQLVQVFGFRYPEGRTEP